VVRQMKHRLYWRNSCCTTYNATIGNVPTRAIFSLLFSGIAFSTGGYSAEYGGTYVPLLNTEDNPDQNKTSSPNDCWFVR
jgi:hypothetical protein